MLPAFRQRLLIAAAAIAGGLVWLLAVDALSAADASSGISLFDARIGVLPGLLLLALAALPAVALGLIVSSTGHPLGGVFTVATGLLFLAGAGGSIQGYLWRHGLPEQYGWLIAESLLWAGLVLALLAMIRRLRPGVRERLDRLATDHHWGDELVIAVPDGRALLAGGISLLGAAAMATLLLQGEQTGQVIGALLLAFLIGALLAQIVVPQPNPTAILLSPLVLAAIAYGRVLFDPTLTTRDDVLRAWYAGALWGPALALPIFYASAGVVGCTLGIGMGQSIHRAREQAVETSAS